MIGCEDLQNDLDCVGWGINAGCKVTSGSQQVVLNLYRWQDEYTVFIPISFLISHIKLYTKYTRITNNNITLPSFWSDVAESFNGFVDNDSCSCSFSGRYLLREADMRCDEGKGGTSDDVALLAVISVAEDDDDEVLSTKLTMTTKQEVNKYERDKLRTRIQQCSNCK